MGKEYIASVVSPPRSGGVQNVPVTTSSGATATALETGVLWRYVEVMAIGDDMEIMFGGAGATVDWTTSTGKRLASGETAQYCLEKGDTHVVAESGTGDATLKIVASSPPANTIG